MGCVNKTQLRSALENWLYADEDGAVEFVIDLFSVHGIDLIAEDPLEYKDIGQRLG